MSLSCRALQQSCTISEAKASREHETLTLSAHTRSAYRVIQGYAASLRTKYGLDNSNPTLESYLYLVV